MVLRDILYVYSFVRSIRLPETAEEKVRLSQVCSLHLKMFGTKKRLHLLCVTPSANWKKTR